MKIHWKQCLSYDDAKDHTGIVYVHVWNHKPFYWGMCDTSVFGGNARVITGRTRNPRYGSSYKHWIEACLRHGGSLFVGRPEGIGQYTIEDIELTLLHQFPSELNAERGTARIPEHIEHLGQKPEFMK